MKLGFQFHRNDKKNQESLQKAKENLVMGFRGLLKVRYIIAIFRDVSHDERKVKFIGVNNYH